MIKNFTINMTFMMLEPLNSSPALCETDCQLIGGDGLLIGRDGQIIACDGQQIACDGQLITVYSNSSASVFQLIISLMTGLIFHKWLGYAGNRLLLQQEGVCGPLHHSRQDHAHQQSSVKREAVSRKNYSFMFLRRSISRYTWVATLT